MPYTLWHREQLIGETHFEGERTVPDPHVGERPHLAGVFRPTAYGRRLMPRLCGIMTACLELKEEATLRGSFADEMPPELTEELFETTAAGARILDLGRVLTEVVLRDPGGITLRVASMAFIDLGELAALSRKLGLNETVDFESVPAETAEFLVSVTLAALAPQCRPMMLQ
jgi:hypothetical protein